jgi:hypothetical protein
VALMAELFFRLPANLFGLNCAPKTGHKNSVS